MVNVNREPVCAILVFC